MTRALVTGGAGFFGGILKHRLLDEEFDCVSVDLQPDWEEYPRLRSVQGDIRDRAILDSLFAKHRFTPSPTAPSWVS